MTVQNAIGHHLGFAVYDADATAAKYTQMLGGTFRLMPPYVLSNLYGRPGKLKVYYGAMNGYAIEIIETTEGVTPHSEWMRTHGEGIQHLGVYVPDVLDAAKQAIADGGRIEWIYPSKGIVQVTGGSSVEQALAEIAPHSLVYVDPRDGGAIVELLGPPIHESVYGGALRGLEDIIGAKLPPVGESTYGQPRS
jgi:catechol 2,3-dioxygenase-like lactoylglutathione lyase family enzyme